MAKERSILRLLINNIFKSFKLLPPKGKLVGHDHLGNKYYQADANPHSMRKSGNRWFEPENPGDWQQNLPAEWEAWLRGRRPDPPTQEELMHNYSIAQMKKIKGAEIAATSPALSNQSDSTKQEKGFPKLEDYEREPGQFSDKNN